MMMSIYYLLYEYLTLLISIGNAFFVIYVVCATVKDTAVTVVLQ